MTTMLGWVLRGDGEGEVWPVPSQEGPPSLSVGHAEASAHLQGVFYWSSPPSYLGNKV